MIEEQYKPCSKIHSSAILTSMSNQQYNQIYLPNSQIPMPGGKTNFQSL